MALNIYYDKDADLSLIQRRKVAIVDGAGNSWGYILPIRAVEQALSCQRGASSLPKPFDVQQQAASIRTCASLDACMAAYARGVEAGVGRRGGVVRAGRGSCG